MSTPKIQGVNSSFPGCCGATILHGLAANYDKDARHATKTESAQFAVTNENQIDAETALRAAKFVPLATWENKNTDNMLTLWGRGVHKA